MAKQAVEAEPDNFAYRDSYGWALFKIGRVDEALTELKRASEIEDPDGIILDHLADALLKSGERELAEKNWLRALELLPASSEKARTAIKAKLDLLKAKFVPE
jgi:Flp pilus assembly protein TadD